MFIVLAKPIGFVALTVHWMRRCRQRQLVKHQIQPTAELEARLCDRAGVHKTKLLVKRNARLVFGVDTANHHVIVLFFDGCNRFSSNASPTHLPRRHL